MGQSQYMVSDTCLYNLLSWMLVIQPYFIMQLLILNPTSPSNDIDVYLHPLIDELNELWTNSINTYDAHTSSTFCMCATLLWTIDDFSVCIMRSGWNTKELMACSYYQHEIISKSLPTYGIIYRIRHRHFLLVDHVGRMKGPSMVVTNI